MKRLTSRRLSEIPVTDFPLPSNVTFWKKIVALVGDTSVVALLHIFVLSRSGRHAPPLGSYFWPFGLIPSIPPKNSDKKIMAVAAINQWLWSEESGQWFENVH